MPELGIKSVTVVAVVHRASNKVIQYIERADTEGVRNLIVRAGIAAHLAMNIAGQTGLPVICLSNRH